MKKEDVLYKILIPLFLVIIAGVFGLYQGYYTQKQEPNSPHQPSSTASLPDSTPSLPEGRVKGNNSLKNTNNASEMITVFLVSHIEEAPDSILVDGEPAIITDPNGNFKEIKTEKGSRIFSIFTENHLCKTNQYVSKNYEEVLFLCKSRGGSK